MNWFAPFGWIHRPISIAGWLLTLAAATYMVHVFIAVDARSHSATDTLYAVYLHWGLTFLGWDWIARRTSTARNG